MVNLFNKRSSVADELVGLEPPTPYIAALLAYTAKQKREDEMVGKKIGKAVTGPADSMARKIKAMSLFPSIYSKRPMT